MFPGYGGCLCCGASWKAVNWHITKDSEDTGCFPLCERCWLILGTPEKRMPYYEKLVFQIWGENFQESWTDIKQAVMEGG